MQTIIGGMRSTAKRLAHGDSTLHEWTSKADNGSVLPVLDLTDADKDPTSFRTRLREAAHDIGFFDLVGHGVSRAQFDEVLTSARQFFALPVEADPENPIFNTYGENAWKSRTRAHPDVAEMHHGIKPKRSAAAAH
jgi:non-heme dioxygenase-like protein